MHFAYLAFDRPAWLRSQVGFINTVPISSIGKGDNFYLVRTGKVCSIQDLTRRAGQEIRHNLVELIEM